MIVSASYRTDIPAFYGDWFMKRLTAGECLVANPYGGPPYRVSLDREAVDGFVFWTRNPLPFTENLAEINVLGYPFVVHVTIVGYPMTIDRSVPPVDAQVDTFVRLAGTYGSAALVWRYDPIVLSSLTPAAFHLDNFERICARLTGSTDEVVISFVNPYRKSRRNLDAAAKQHGFSWWQADEAEVAGVRVNRRVEWHARFALLSTTIPDPRSPCGLLCGCRTIGAGLGSGYHVPAEGQQTGMPMP